MNRPLTKEQMNGLPKGRFTNKFDNRKKRRDKEASEFNCRGKKIQVIPVGRKVVKRYVQRIEGKMIAHYKD